MLVSLTIVFLGFLLEGYSFRLSPFVGIFPWARAHIVNSAAPNVHKYFGFRENDLFATTGAAEYSYNLATDTFLDSWKAAKSSELRLAGKINDVEVLRVYRTILSDVDNSTHSALKFAAFRYLVDSVVSMLLELQDEASVLKLFTDAHMTFIDNKYQCAKHHVPINEVYWLVGMLHYVYSQVAYSSHGIVTRSAADQLAWRWLAPVLTHISRQDMNFNTGDAFVGVPKRFNLDFTTMLRGLTLEVFPKLRLPNERSKLSPVAREDPSFSAQETANRAFKLLCTVAMEKDLGTLESKLISSIRQNLSMRMSKLIRPLRSTEESESAVNVIQDWMNLAHESLASVLLIWQVRYKLVGQTDNEIGERKVEFIKPLHFTNQSSLFEVCMTRALESVPSELWARIESAVQDRRELAHSSTLLLRTAIYSDAVRHTAWQELRSVLPFVSGTADADTIFTTVLTELISSALIASELNEKEFCQHVVAFSAFGETLDVSDVRTVGRAAFKLGLERAVHQLYLDMSLNNSVREIRVNLRERLQFIERCVGMGLQLTGEDALQCRRDVFESMFSELLSAGAGAGQNGDNIFNLVDHQRKAAEVAGFLSIDPQEAVDCLKDLSLDRFYQFSVTALLNADITASMPMLSATFEKQVFAAAASIMLSPAEVESLFVTVAGDMFCSILLQSLEQHSRSNFEPVDHFLLKAYYIYQHPLLVRLQRQFEKDVKVNALHNAVQQAGTEGCIKLIRMLDSARLRRAGLLDGKAPTMSNGGWGSSPSTAESSDVSTKVVEFIQSVQASLFEKLATDV